MIPVHITATHSNSGLDTHFTINLDQGRFWPMDGRGLLFRFFVPQVFVIVERINHVAIACGVYQRILGLRKECISAYYYRLDVYRAAVGISHIVNRSKSGGINASGISNSILIDVSG